MQLLKTDILAATKRGDALAKTTARLCVRLESLVPGAICTVLRVDDDDRYMDLAGPSLDEDYRRAFNGLAVGPASEPFGQGPELANEAREIAADPAWRSFAHLPLQLGLRACCTRPVASQDGRALGIMCFYFRQPRRLIPSEVAILAEGANLCSLALERAQQAADLHRLAYRDLLTGLPNRAAFNAVSSRAGSARGDFGGLLLIDLDDLRRINGTFGRQVGDQLIETAAARVERVAGPLTVFRRGGDEFAVIIPKGQVSAVNFNLLARKFLAALGSPVDCAGGRTVLRASIGGSALEEGATIDELERRAVIALAEAKESRRGGFVAYSRDLGATVDRRISAIRDVDLALSEGRIEAHYQPIVSLKTGDVLGLEALFRLISPDGVALPAGDYFEATTDPYTATRLTCRMLEIVARDMRDWREQDVVLKPVGINLSSEDFRSGRLPEAIRDIFGREGVPLSQLVLEVTESVYMGGDGDVGTVIAQLRATGMKVALDDFGTGFASLTHLFAVPVDYIKIDRSFTARITRGRRASAIVEGLIGMAGKLGAEVVAEGVETSDQAAQLQAWGCERGQGLLFSRAIDRHAVVRLLRDSPGEGADAAFPAVPMAPPLYTAPEQTSAGHGRETVRYAVLLCGKDWRVVSERRQLGRFASRRSALHCALGLAREAAIGGAEIELLYSGPGGELRSYRRPASWRISPASPASSDPVTSDPVASERHPLDWSMRDR